jgi:S1/P1 Nuclease
MQFSQLLTREFHNESLYRGRIGLFLLLHMCALLAKEAKFKMSGRSSAILHTSMQFTRCCCLLLVIVMVVHGWGQKGHEMVGNIASALLSEAALYRISLILNVSHSSPAEFTATAPALDVEDRWWSTRYVGFSNCSEYCSPLAMVADWADQVRYRYHWSAPLHYIDIRDDIIPFGCPVTSSSASTVHSHCSFNYTRDCPDDACVAGAIVNYTEQLYNRVDDATFELLIFEQGQQLKESLMFLVHFVGDIHQPLHCSRTTDRGGNNIDVHYDVSVAPSDHVTSARDPLIHNIYKFHLRHHHSLNLHAVWDDSIIETMLERDFDYSRNTMEASLLSYIWKTRASNPSLYNNVWLGCADAASKNCVSQWAEESFQYALQYAYANVDGKEIVDGSILDDRYYETRSPIVREKLAVAAVRLADNLEHIFGDVTYL